MGLEIKQLTRLQIIRYCEKLEKENTELKEHKENLIWLDKKKDKEIEKLEKENKKLKEIICLYESDEEEYKNKIEELEDEIRRIYDEASYLGFKF